jgi:hypothetical protein
MSPDYLGRSRFFESDKAATFGVTLEGRMRNEGMRIMERKEG